MINKGNWKKLNTTKNHISDLVISSVTQNLDDRGDQERALADDVIFAELADASVMAIAKADYRLAIDLFHACWEMALAHPHSAKIHKGAMTFNVAVAYLRNNDFITAFYFFELAQKETQLTTGDDGWGIFDFDLFDRSFWKVIDAFQQAHALSQYNAFWLTPFSAAHAKADWAALTEASKILYLLSNAQRINYRRLRSTAALPMTRTFGYAYWELISNLCRLLETELIAKGIAGPGLRAKVLNGITGAHSPIATFHADVTALHNTIPVNSPTDFNLHYAAIRDLINNAAEPRERRIAAGAYLAAVVRNQVQHQVADTMIIFTDRDAALFTVDVLLCLCKVASWAS